MSLSDLYRCHVEMCFQMAAASKNAEVRQQWTKLGERWRQKAEADEHANSHELTLNLVKGRSGLELAQRKLEAAPNSAPTLILGGASLEQKAKPAPLRSGSLSDIWARIASPINLEH